MAERFPTTDDWEDLAGESDTTPVIEPTSSQYDSSSSLQPDWDVLLED